MNNSTISKNSAASPQAAEARRSWLIKGGVLLFWLGLWQITAMLLGQEILLASPFAVLQALGQLVTENGFWQSIILSFGRIMLGFLLALVVGVVLAALAGCSRLIRELVTPVLTVIKSTPVASFVILALIWVTSAHLATFIAFLMGLPIIYTNVYRGIISADRQMLEMAQVFRVTRWRKLVYIYLPEIAPFFISACQLAVGLCWKAGIAAEVIGLPQHSIGGNLYQAKLFWNTAEMFAWTLVIILISLVFEKLVLLVVDKLKSRLERV